ncbi:MAG: L-threonylcarbamoyladenylate synthase [Pseudomonadota bacterium]
MTNDGRLLRLDGNIDAFGEALAALKAGKLVGIPTETVYGLAADACDAKAVAAIFAAKGRPDFNPLIVHVSDAAMANRYVKIALLAEKLIAAFWPGALTLVLPLRDCTGLAPAVTAGLPTLAVRHPKGVMADLAKALDRPIAAPSANTSGRISATTAQHVMDDLGKKLAIVLDNGPCAVGLESTIVKVDDGKLTLLREGGITAEQIEQVTGMKPAKPETRAIEAPGMLLAHYAPSKPVRLNATQGAEDEALLAFGSQPIAGGCTSLNLSKSGNLEEAAHNLYAFMKALDATDAHAIAVQAIPGTGIGRAINDRLKRAATGAAENHEKAAS